MKTARTTAVLIVSLSLMVPGCACFRPPAYDRQAWEARQQQAEARQECARENDPLGMALYFSYVGYCFGAFGWHLAHK